MAFQELMNNHLMGGIKCLPLVFLHLSHHHLLHLPRLLLLFQPLDPSYHSTSDHTVAKAEKAECCHINQDTNKPRVYGDGQQHGKQQ